MYKKIFIIFLVSIKVLWGWEVPDVSFSDTKKYFKKAQKAYNSYQDNKDQSSEHQEPNSMKVSAPPSFGKLLRIPINKKEVFSSTRCGEVFDKGVFLTCYQPELKISSMLFYSLRGSDLKRGYIKKRPQFYPERHLKDKNRARPRDYKRSGYDRGHIRSHASTAYNKKNLYETYNMINIWPQTPGLNRHTWIKAEKYERLLARKLGSVNVLNIALIRRSHKTIGKGVVVPSGFYKILYSDDSTFKRCLYYDNKELSSAEKKRDKLKNHEIDCSSIRY